VEGKKGGIGGRSAAFFPDYQKQKMIEGRKGKMKSFVSRCLLRTRHANRSSRKKQKSAHTESERTKFGRIKGNQEKSSREGETRARGGTCSHWETPQ